MKNLNEMSKTEMEQEICFAKDFVNSAKEPHGRVKQWQSREYPRSAKE